MARVIGRGARQPRGPERRMWKNLRRPVLPSWRLPGGRSAVTTSPRPAATEIQ
jgi:hypothetical protein